MEQRTFKEFIDDIKNARPTCFLGKNYTVRNRPGTFTVYECDCPDGKKDSFLIKDDAIFPIYLAPFEVCPDCDLSVIEDAGLRLMDYADEISDRSLADHYANEALSREKARGLPVFGSHDYETVPYSVSEQRKNGVDYYVYHELIYELRDELGALLRKAAEFRRSEGVTSFFEDPEKYIKEYGDFLGIETYIDKLIDEYAAEI